MVTKNLEPIALTFVPFHARILFEPVTSQRYMGTSKN
jgi:hypothetical protein